MRGTQFYRPARSYPPVLPTNDIIISAPPVLQQTQTGVMGWLQYVLPTVGGLGSLIFVFAYHDNTLMMVAGIAMAVASVGGGIAMGIAQRYSQNKQRKQQRKLYLERLAQYRVHLKSLAEKQHQSSQRLYPGYEEIAQQVKQRCYLWERRPSDDDFLTVRIGLGPAPLCCRVSLDLSTDIMVQYVPELRSQAEALVADCGYLNDMPSLISLCSIGVLAINGRPSDTRALARALLCQIVAFQSPEDVRCLACFPEASVSEWSWLKWLPHVRRLRQVKAETQYAPDHLCMLAHTIEDIRSLLLSQIKPELDRRRRLNEEKEKQENASVQTFLPHLFVILDGFSPFNELGQLPELDMLFRDAAALGVTVICLVDDLSQEPAQIQARISVAPIGVLEYEEMRKGGQHLEGITPDTVDPGICEQIARSMAPLSLAEAGAQQDLSQDVRLLDLLNLADADTFAVSETWRPRERQALLRVPIGMRNDGKALIIDFKEAADKGMGPHGLIIGATGSGKSELLRTIVVSLAMTHDPQTVNFVLIDFKGGASFADFGALPHVAGIITNLADDISLVDRVYYSLLGEQQRRQRMLHDAGNLDNIKQYQAKWQMNPQMEPMPHLLIIADEFAELMANRPEFLDLFITMGRVGRSLGLHLLFATQRLEEGRIRGLEGHLRYRICLRTFSVAESNSVLGKPDAYYLPSAPGIGYFKVDTDTYHLFKTALISIPYVPAREQISPRSRIREFTSAGKLVKYQPTGSLASSLPTRVLEHVEPSDLHTEMDVVIERLNRAGASASQSRYPVHQIWLAPLPKQLPLSTVLQKCQRQDLDGRHWAKQPPFGALCIPLGLLDMPQQQAQEPFLLDFSGTGGHLALVGAPQSGKSTFLRMLVTSFMLTHSPQDVQIYCIDMGGGLLRVFEQSPHVGAVCGKSDRDKLRRMVRQVRKVIEDREFLFREQHIDSMAAFRTRRQAGEFADFPFGDVFLIIDNFAQFVQEFDMEAEIAELIAGGLAYGVHVIIAANRWAEVRIKLRDNIGTRLELRLNDPADSEFGKAAATSVPVGVPGRGINKEKLQFQISLPLLGSDEEHSSVQQTLEELIERVRQHWNGPTAPPVRMLPALVRWDDMPPATATNQPSGIPLGLEEFRLEPIFLDLISDSPHFLILGDSECGKTTLLRAWMRGIEQRYKKEEASFAIVDYRKTLVDFAESKNLLTYAYNAATLTACVGNIRVDLEKRMKTDADLPLSRLQVRKRWTGRHYFLFVDDYDSLVSGTNTPLNPLVDYLVAGRDIGFHVVIARRVSGIGRSSFEPVLQRLREMGTSGIIMSGDSQEGRILHNQAATLQPPGRGYFVRRNQPSTLVQVAFAEPAYKAE